jgi:DNA (cytosine-5)-methyltransferase 1
MADRRLVSLFSGIGGFEVAAQRRGANAVLLCENEPTAQAVLRDRFPDARLATDIQGLRRLPPRTWMVTAGFPCQDLSSVGLKSGIGGERSSLVDEVFRLLETQNPDWVVLENVMFMLHIEKGKAMQHVIEGLESCGFNWAYRLLNTSDFGLPQRRRRLYFMASRKHDAATAMFSVNSERPEGRASAIRRSSYGFYWTEGTYATGLTVNGVPPLKSGSTIGIPSPPAILFANGDVGTPTVGDAERLQGFRRGWTKAAATVGRESLRWRLVGNAVSVPVATQVIASAVSAEGISRRRFADAVELLPIEGKWPDAAFGSRGKRYAMPNRSFRGMKRPPAIHRFLCEDVRPLSAKATLGFLKRAQKGGQRFPDGFLKSLEQHATSMAQHA